MATMLTRPWGLSARQEAPSPGPIAVSNSGNALLSDITDTDSEGVTVSCMPAGLGCSERQKRSVMFLTQRQWMAKWITAVTIRTTPLRVWLMSQVVRLTRNMVSHPGLFTPW